MKDDDGGDDEISVFAIYGRLKEGIEVSSPKNLEKLELRRYLERYHGKRELGAGSSAESGGRKKENCG